MTDDERALLVTTAASDRPWPSEAYEEGARPEQQTITPGRGSPESAEWFRERLGDLGLSQSAMARLMLERGDDRPVNTILRNLGRMASGEARVSGEMRVLLRTLEMDDADRRRAQLDAVMT